MGILDVCGSKTMSMPTVAPAPEQRRCGGAAGSRHARRPRVVCTIADDASRTVVHWYGRGVVLRPLRVVKESRQNAFEHDLDRGKAPVDIGTLWA
ncbi:MAG: hypothetical protein KGN77_03480 [Xanthomonadaceae bacterium]|nr:hypothetical protein [Xanthomonadaceae bacterium]MDE1962963.1 hypothetical protein [Xanthomonadaceae bacterium]